MKTMTWIGGAALLGAALSSCVSSAPQVVTKEGAVYEVRSHSMTLANTVRMSRRNVRENAQGFIQVQMEAVNLTRRDVQLQYRFQWLDANMMALDTGSVIWKPVALGARSTRYLTSTSPHAAARDFVMEVRFVHDTSRY